MYNNGVNFDSKNNKYYLIEYKSIESIFDIIIGGDIPKNSFSKKKTEEYKIPILSNGVGENSIYGYTNIVKILKPSLTISARGTIGWTSLQEFPFYPIVRLIVLTPKIKTDLRYLYHLMKKIEKDYKVSKSGIPQLTKPMIKDILLPILSIDKQEYVSNILDNFEKICNDLNIGLPKEIELRTKQYEYYREQLLTFDK